MTTINLSEETGSALYERRAELASLIALGLQEHQPALRRRRGNEDPARLRAAVETLLSNLSTALLLEQPELFTNVVAKGSALPAIVKPQPGGRRHRATAYRRDAASASAGTGRQPCL